MSGATHQVTLELPETWVKLPERERNGLLLAGVYEATRARVRQLQAEIAECEQQVRHFEDRYGMALPRFEAEQLPVLDTLQVHEDFNDWFYWQSVLDTYPHHRHGASEVEASSVRSLTDVLEILTAQLS